MLMTFRVSILNIHLVINFSSLSVVFLFYYSLIFKSTGEDGIMSNSKLKSQSEYPNKFMKKRLFIAIDLPEEIKEELTKFQKKFKKINLRWTKRENLHITLIFIGWIDEAKIEFIKNSIKQAIQNFPSFLLKLDRIILGPDEERARMIWAIGETSLELQRLREKIAQELEKNNIFFDKRHPLKLHITLARARERELRGLKIREELSLVFPAKEIYLMESELKKEGPEYRILEIIPLSD